MSKNNFDNRFRKLAYNRIKEQGSYAEIPVANENVIGKRPAFGKNGKGRFGAFAFGEIFKVVTTKENKENVFQVYKDNSNLPAFKQVGETIDSIKRGTEILVEHALKPSLSDEDIRKEIGMRFLIDPHFKVKLNGIEITFEDIPTEHVEVINLLVEGVGEIKITVIDVRSTDKTTHQHGIAWHVKRRLVGECTWKGSGSEHLLDGRKSEAKRYIFIVEADGLEKAVLPDWTMFNPHDEKYKKAFSEVQNVIKSHLLELNKSKREERFKSIEESALPELKKMGIVSREKWETFIKEVQEECPSINDDDLEKVGKLLANLENTNSKYNLLEILANATPDELDSLNDILKKWNIDFAKIVLDEIEYRTTLLQKLEMKVRNEHTDEVHELQPLFHAGLWIFGPEYETIEYTSNKGMTEVIQKLFDKEEIVGSRIRPDFVILPDGTVGLYSFPRYGSEGEEIGTERLTIVELKKPNIPIGDDQKDQAWKYVKELYEKGLLKNYTQVTCFVLGTELKQNEGEPRTEKTDKVLILPLDYDTIIRRANSRLLNLHKKIENSPFLEKTRVEQILREKGQKDLF